MDILKEFPVYSPEKNIYLFHIRIDTSGVRYVVFRFGEENEMRPAVMMASYILSQSCRDRTAIYSPGRRKKIGEMFREGERLCFEVKRKHKREAMGLMDYLSLMVEAPSAMAG